jgi:O-antigen/teichoic acid export membrane protein
MIRRMSPSETTREQTAGPGGSAPGASGHALRGATLLLLRQGLVSLLTLAGIVVLSLLLEPREFALYGFVTTVILIAAAVGDLGLGASIIRGRDPDDRQIRGSFALQLAFWVPFCAIGAAVGAAIGAYGFAPGTIVLLFATLLLLSLQALPTALLERRLAFGSIALLEVAQRLVFVGGAIALAAAAPGEAAIPAAAAAAALVGYPAALAVARWRWPPRFAAGEPLFRGFSSDWWQSRIANQLSYAAYPLLGGLLFSQTEVGLLVWALAVSSAPALISPMVARAIFPAIAREAPAEQIAVYRKFLRGLLVLGLPLCAALFALAEPLTLEVFGEKWRGGITVLRLESVTTALGLALTASVPLLFLVLRPRFVKWTMVAGTASVWLLSVALAPLADYRAISIATIAVAAATLLVFDRRLIAERRYSQLADMRAGLFATVVAAAVGLGLAGAVHGIPALAAAGVAVMAVQVGLTFALGAGVDPRIVIRAARSARPRGMEGQLPPEAAEVRS